MYIEIDFKKNKDMVESINRINKIISGKGLLLLLVIIISSFELFAQTNIYTQNFGTGATFPTGWSSTNGAWLITNSQSSSGYTGASGSSNAEFLNSSTSSTLTFSNNLSTIGYSNITVLWGARLYASFPGTIVFQWSSDGTNWNSQAFTNVVDNTTWALVNNGSSIALPAAAAGISNLRFRFVVTGAGIGSNTSYRLDDFTVQGTSCILPSAPSGATNGSVCGAGTVVLSVNDPGAGLAIDWYDSPGSGTGTLLFTGISFTTPAISATTNYYAETRNISGGCVSSSRTTVTAKVNAIPLSAVTNHTNITCNGAGNGSIAVQASGGTSPYTFSINNATYIDGDTGDTKVYNGLLPNTVYQVKVKDFNGCISK